MDSITQATLGAAVGQAVLGEKMGNKAILIGAVAGTIPDLDVLSRLFLDHQIYGLIYHRGITHSIAFTLLASPIFGWLTWKYYEKGWNKKLWVQSFFTFFFGLLYSLFFAGLLVGTYYSQSIVMAIMTLGMGLGFISLYKSLRSTIVDREKKNYEVSMKAFTLMYFLAFLTHWLIDACTAYGTQIFEPFSRYRVAFNNISIVDPLYTVPMILGLMIAIFSKSKKNKKIWNYIGISIATLYMASTFYSKSLINEVVLDNLKKQGIEYNQYITYPTIFNSILWQTTVETDSFFYYGYYSLWDKDNKMDFVKLPKNHSLIDKYQGEEYMDILLWFANGYYNVIEQEDGSVVFNNLRFGLMGLPEDSDVPIENRYIFRFKLVEKDGKFDVEEDRDFERISIAETAATLWKRIKGNK